MRKFKFRAWHQEAREMLYEDSVGDCFRQLNDNQPIEVTQFTGLNDHDEKEIYEGDIIRFFQDDFEYHDTIFSSFKIMSKHIRKEVDVKVCFKDGCFETEYIHEKDFVYATSNVVDNGLLINILSVFKDIKKPVVIGNIFENPELLGDKQ